MKRAKKSCKKEVLLLMHFLIGMPAAALSRHCAFLRAPLKVKPFSMFFRLMTHSQIIDFPRLVVCPGKICYKCWLWKRSWKKNNRLQCNLTLHLVDSQNIFKRLGVDEDAWTEITKLQCNIKNIEALQRLLKTLPGK